MELVYDEATDTLRVKHPVRIQPDQLSEQRLDAYTHTLQAENTTQSAAIDVGANNTLAIVTSTGDTAVYHARPLFEQFHRYSQQIAALQSNLPDGQYTSWRIQRRFDERGRKRDHARDAAVKHAAEWLLERNVDTVYVGDLTDVLDAHWSASVNEKTHAFWSYRQLLDRIELTLGDVGITVESVSEEDSSSLCPECGSRDVSRKDDDFKCHECAMDAHADVAGAWNLLQSVDGPMARPAALAAERQRDAPNNSPNRDGAYWEWNGHNWTPTDFRGTVAST
ncbi:transposase [Halobacterium sp. KA-6]|uniref:transposase n=1 Tax=Halobacterium sp. KA-6 TaxID=2896368 RepID=UPI001E58A739|nr:transposase [Halobacterium sp. KA-6]MCD2203327.1 transposase [Halobacterium sp. KA-6]